MAAVPAATAARNSSETTSGDIRVAGSGERPQLFFACCDQGTAAAQSLFADGSVIPKLQELHAGVAIAITDHDPARSALVRRLNSAGIPAIAWIQMSREQGVYVNAGDIPQVSEEIAGFERWSAQNSLRWQGIGLDIEPNFVEFSNLKGHPFRLMGLLTSRYFQRTQVFQARAACAALIRNLQAQGYFVQTYQMPFIVSERDDRSTVLERLLGIIDARGDQEALMLYTSFAPKVGAGMIWTLGPHAQAIAIGVTQGDPSAGPRGVPLDWQEFSRDLMVAAHFSHTVGVYNLEGSVAQGFLPRLQSMNWSESVVIPAGQIQRAARITRAVHAGLWLATWMPAIVFGSCVLLAGVLWRRRHRLVR